MCCFCKRKWSCYTSVGYGKTMVGLIFCVERARIGLWKYSFFRFRSLSRLFFCSSLLSKCLRFFSPSNSMLLLLVFLVLPLPLLLWFYDIVQSIFPSIITKRTEIYTIDTSMRESGSIFLWNRTTLVCRYDSFFAKNSLPLLASYFCLALFVYPFPIFVEE